MIILCQLINHGSFYIVGGRRIQCQGVNAARFTNNDDLKDITYAFKKTHLAVVTEKEDAIINTIASTKIRNTVRKIFLCCRRKTSSVSMLHVLRLKMVSRTSHMPLERHTLL